MQAQEHKNTNYILRIYTPYTLYYIYAMWYITYKKLALQRAESPAEHSIYLDAHRCSHPDERTLL